MTEFGKTLRIAREAKGYTVSQIADMTHLKSSIVEGLENEDFSMIAAPIYGRGFVKLYCEVVGLEAKPLVDEFMAISSGKREATIRERPLARPDAEPMDEFADQVEAPEQPEPVTTPFVTERAPEPEPDLFRQDTPPPPPPPPPPPSAPAREPSLSRYAPPVHERAMPTRSDSLLNLRICLLAACALALLLVLIFGLRGLYRATTSNAADTPATEEAKSVVPAKPTAKPAEPAAKPAEPAAKPAEPAAKPAVQRTPQKIPSLYID